MKRILFVVLAFAFALPAFAQQRYPEKPVKLIVPFPPGGGTDVLGRILAAKLTELWGQQVIVENRAGAQGNVGTAAGAKAAPDGYTLTFAHQGALVINPHLYKDTGYDTLKDFAAVARTTEMAFVGVAHPSVPAKDLKELAAYAKKNLVTAYDPALAKKLVQETGYGGQTVYLDTPVGRYVNDKEVTQAMIPMLNAVGIKAKLRTPEWATLWANVQKGKTPFYYMGRGSVVDPSVALSQYFETGGSPRIGISDPKIDAALRKERASFDPAERKKALNAAFKEIVDAAPACFMWKHNFLYGIAKNIDYKPDPGMRIFGDAITVR